MENASDPRLTDPRYDFRFFGSHSPIEQARERLRFEFRIANRCRGADGKMSHFARHNLSIANRMMWAARNHDRILMKLRGV